LEAADGFNLTPTHLPHGINEREGTTLRENLGLLPNTKRHGATAP